MSSVCFSATSTNVFIAAFAISFGVLYAAISKTFQLVDNVLTQLVVTCPHCGMRSYGNTGAGCSRSYSSTPETGSGSSTPDILGSTYDRHVDGMVLDETEKTEGLEPDDDDHLPDLNNGF